MKKILLTKSNSLNIAPKPAIAVHTMEDTDKNTYLKRKAMQSAYQDLFQALLRLPDRQVQARVMDAINGKIDKRKTVAEEIIQTCDKCKRQQTNRILVNVATQTTNFSNNLTNNCFKDNTNSVISNSEDSSETPTPIDNKTEMLEKELLVVQDEPKVTKRKQRRKLRGPQVIKKSQAKQVQQKQPIMQKRKAQELKSNGDSNTNDDDASPIEKRQRSSSISSIDLAEAYCRATLWDLKVDDTTLVLNMMMDEYRQAEIIQPDGLIPIHSAIIRSDFNGLRRQIYVWKKLKNVDLNELCTEDGEDCLQLAVVQNNLHSFVDVLIENGLSLNSLDDQSNTLIHLAVLSDVDREVLSSLMDRIDLNTLLLLNDDGFTPLHLAVRQDNFLLAEVMLNTIDKRSFGGLLYNREYEESKDNFLKFYEKRCDNLEIGNSVMKQSKGAQRLKRRLIDAGEMRSGNTALFYAIENKLEHLIYFLLAHFADPRVDNHSGQNSRSYLGEFAKTLNLSLKIDRVMEQVEIFLEQ